MPGASDDVQRWQGMASGSIDLATQLSTLILVDALDFWQVSDVTIGCDGVTMDAACKVRAALYFQEADGIVQHPFASFRQVIGAGAGGWHESSGQRPSWFPEKPNLPVKIVGEVSSPGRVVTGGIVWFRLNYQTGPRVARSTDA